MKRLLLLFTICLPLLSQGQVSLNVTVNSGNSGTSCQDLFGLSDPLWEVNINNQGFVTYTQDGSGCVDVPNIQFSEVYECVEDYPSTIQLCFRAFEDDGFPCTEVPECGEQICQNFPTPALGSTVTYSLLIPNNGSNQSWGSVNFTISSSGMFLGNGNDFICDAIDLGVLNLNGELGDSTLSSYNNYCASSQSDPTVDWTNENGVWFTFLTDEYPGGMIDIIAKSDPEITGDGIDLQLALYQSDNNLCNGGLTLIQSSYNEQETNYNQSMSLSCLLPNTRYFLLVDGQALSTSFPFGDKGVFGLSIIDNGFQQGGDQICQALDVGNPDNGVISLLGTNICATAINDPQIFGDALNPVWYQFQAPSIGRVFVLVNGYLDDWVDVRLGLFSSDNNDCSGNLTLLQESYATVDGFPESFIESCLIPGQSYFLMVDGSLVNSTGNFSLEISSVTNSPSIPSFSTDIQTSCDSYVWIDGNTYTSDNNTATWVIPNEFGCDSTITLDLTILNSNIGSETITECDSFTWSTNGQTYTQSGQYTEVLTNQSGCDSTVTLNLTITNSNSTSESITECDSYTWSTNGQTYTESGQYTEVLTNQSGCDSTVTLNLIINNSNTGSESITECDSYTWNTNGQTYTESGQYTEVLPNQDGCDSTVTLDLTINSSSSSTQTQTGIDSYTWSVNNETYTESGTYTAVIPNVVGCDSIITLELTLEFVGLYENESSYVAVFPNPTFNSFILSTKDMNNMNFTLVDIQGKVVLTGKIESSEEKVDISNLSRGQYNLVFEDESISPISIIKN